MNTAPILSDLVDEEPELLPLIERFIARLPAQLAGLDTHRRNGDWERLRETAHELKGAAGNLGFPELMDLAHTVETHAASRNSADLDRLLRDIAGVCARIRARAS
jgi:HPt (histidine-containing phosphotransfer) domain-containing protein